MAVGEQLTVAGVNQTLTQYAVQLRNLMTQIREEQENIVSAGLTGLQAAGFSAADAANVITMWSYMANPAGCYFGTVQQGGSGGTGAVLFNFDNALSPLWAGQ